MMCTRIGEAIFITTESDATGAQAGFGLLFYRLTGLVACNAMLKSVGVIRVMPVFRG